MKLTFLGTGTSFGVPVIGCHCPTCSSEDPRDRRTRHGAVLTLPRGRLLVDVPPELRLQLVREGVDHVDAVWLTHLHADHIHGADDLRIFRFRAKWTCRCIVRRAPTTSFSGGFRTYSMRLSSRLRGARYRNSSCGLSRRSSPWRCWARSSCPLPVPHGPTTVYGFRVGSLGYITDAKSLPPKTLEALKGVKVLVLNALWSGDPHPTHFNVEEAVEAAEAVGAERTFLTHMTHRVRHQELLDALPPGVEPAYDGLTVEVPGQ